MKRVLVLGLVVLLVVGSAVAASSQTPEWIVYDTENSGLPDNYLTYALTIDAQGNIWIGTGEFPDGGGRGLAKFDGEAWRVYNTGNSELPHDRVVALAIDAQEDIWIGTRLRGLAVYREGGVILTRP